MMGLLQTQKKIGPFGVLHKINNAYVIVLLDFCAIFKTFNVQDYKTIIEQS